MSRHVIRYDSGDVFGFTMIAMIFAAIFSCIGAWCTHIVWVIGKLAGDGGVTGGQIILGIIGTLMPPIGVVHGFMIWFGAGF